jgi:hypothetical protein
MAVLFSSILVSCKKHYPPRPVLAADQRSKEEKEALLPHEMLEKEGLRFLINYPKGTAEMTFRLFKESPNRSEVKLGVIEESHEYYVLSNHLDLNTDFILSVEYKDVWNDGAFQLSINGIESLKGPAGLKLPGFVYTKESAGAKREFLKIRKGNLKFAFYSL